MKKLRFGALLLAAAMLAQTCLPVYATSGGASENPENQVQTTDAEADQTEDKTMQISARVPAAAPSYYLTLPETISLGDLDSTQDYVQDYEIGVTVESLGDLKLKITSDRRITYTNTDDSAKALTGYNAFGTQYFTADGTAEGSLTVYKEDIAKVPKGTYTGTITFYTSLVNAAQETEDGTEGEDQTGTSGNVTDDVTTGGNENEGGGTGTQVTEKTVTAHVLMEQNGHIREDRQESMCWPFFHQYADLTVRDDGMVDIVLYLIDPIPGTRYSSYGTPLTNVYATGSTADITAEGLALSVGSADDKVTLHPSDDSYAAAVTIDSANQVEKYFVQDKSGGIFVPEAGDYPSAPVRFSVPLSAVKSSADGTILLTAYVKPMTVWKQFFLVLDDVDDLGVGEDNTTENGYTVVKSTGLDSGVNGLKDYVAAEDTPDGYYTFYIRETDSRRDQEGISEIASLISAGSVSGIATYYEMSLARESDGVTTSVTDTGSYVMEIRLPLDSSKGDILSVYRCHEGTAGIMQALSARRTSGYKDNTYYADWTNGYVYIYTSKFSVYGLYQTMSSTSEEGSTGTGTGTGTGSGTGTTASGDGKYTADVSMRKNDNINTVSMCNPLFYSKADLVISGDTTKVTLYVINPIPNYASEGTPLSSIKFIANGTTYSGSIDTSNKVSRYFSANEQFIPTAGNYYASPITVTIPTSAVKNSASGKVKMSAYVNAVMKSTQEFYVVFSNLTSGETESSGDAIVIDESSSTADTSTGTGAGTTASGISTASTTSGSLASGEYLIPVTAIKEKTDDASMMADYLYPKATLAVDGSTTKLTIFIQHTVAGIDGGGPEWMSYNGTKAVKETNAAELGGVMYDSFTFTLNGEVPSPMLVSMLINAMNMEVKARLVFDFNSKTAVSGSLEDALEDAAEELEEAEAEAEAADTDSGAKPEAEQAEEGAEESASAGSLGYQLVTDAAAQSILFLLLTAVITAGAAAAYWYKKRRL